MVIRFTHCGSVCLNQRNNIFFFYLILISSFTSSRYGAKTCPAYRIFCVLALYVSNPISPRVSLAIVVPNRLVGFCEVYMAGVALEWRPPLRLAYRECVFHVRGPASAFATRFRFPKPLFPNAGSLKRAYNVYAYECMRDIDTLKNSNLESYVKFVVGAVVFPIHWKSYAKMIEFSSMK